MKSEKTNIPKSFYVGNGRAWKALAIKNILRIEYLEKEVNLPAWLFRNTKETEAFTVSQHIDFSMKEVIMMGYDVAFASQKTIKDLTEKDILEDNPFFHQYFFNYNLGFKPFYKNGEKVEALSHKKVFANRVHWQLIRIHKPELWLGVLDCLISPSDKIDQLGQMNRIWQGIAKNDLNFEELLFLQKSIFSRIEKILLEAITELIIEVEPKAKRDGLVLSNLDEASTAFLDYLDIFLPDCFITSLLLNKEDGGYPLIDLSMASQPKGIVIAEDGNQYTSVYGTIEHMEQIKKEIEVCLQHALPMLIRSWLAVGMFDREKIVSVLNRFENYKNYKNQTN